MRPKNQKIILKSRPNHAVSNEHFELIDDNIPNPVDGQVLVRNLYLSLDPYMRGRLKSGKSYAEPQPLGETMLGGTISEIVDPSDSHFKMGELVVGMGGWQQYATLSSGEVRQIPKDGYATYHLGPLGMPGITAWIGLINIGQPKPGDTVVISSAAGAVGSVAGQLAKKRGCRVVGIAGGALKCKHVVEKLGFDACIDYKSHSLKSDFKDATPDGVDIYFENVGGSLFDLVVSRLNPFARIPLCGWISTYDNQELSPILSLPILLTMRAKLEGFIVSESPQLFAPAMEELSELVMSENFHHEESISDGLASAPEAFIGLLQGANLGKQLVKL